MITRQTEGVGAPENAGVCRPGPTPDQNNSKSPDLPTERATWADAQKFCAKASEISMVTVRLPSEAEWEYACRAGTQTTYHSGNDEAALDRVAWYYGNFTGKTHPVGKKEANRFGLYDMHGNVFEWCEDTWQYGYKRAPSDGKPWCDNTTPESMHVVRGGCSASASLACRSASRHYYGIGMSLGFRVVASATGRTNPPVETERNVGGQQASPPLVRDGG